MRNLAIVMGAVVAVVACAVPTQAQGLVADFEFNEGTGTTTADSVVGNDGGIFDATATPVTWSTDTPDGSAASLSFVGNNNGNNDFPTTAVTVSGSTPGTYINNFQPFTVSMDFKFVGGIGNGFPTFATIPVSTGTDAFQILAGRDGVNTDPGGYTGIAWGSAGTNFQNFRTADIVDPEATFGGSTWNNFELKFLGGDHTIATNYEFRLNGTPRSIVTASGFAPQNSPGSNTDLRIGASQGPHTNFGGLIDNLQIELSPEQAGDVNLDGFVDSADFEIIRSNFFSTGASRSIGDLTGDGNVDLEDFGQWKENFPFPAPPLSALSAPVPEPGSVVLLAGMAIMTAAFTRRRSIVVPS